MKKRIGIFLLFLGAHYGFSQHQDQNPEAYTLKSTYEQLSQKPESLLLEQDFYNHFPKDYHSFRRIFHNPDFNGLYLNSQAYLYTLINLQSIEKESIGTILLTLCKGFDISNEKSAQAVQFSTHQFAFSHPQIMIQLLQGMTGQDQKKIATLLTNKSFDTDFTYYEKFLGVLEQEDGVLYEQFKL